MENPGWGLRISIFTKLLRRFRSTTRFGKHCPLGEPGYEEKGMATVRDGHRIEETAKKEGYGQRRKVSEHGADKYSGRVQAQ